MSSTHQSHHYQIYTLRCMHSPRVLMHTGWTQLWFRDSNSRDHHLIQVLLWWNLRGLVNSVFFFFLCPLMWFPVSPNTNRQGQEYLGGERPMEWLDCHANEQLPWWLCSAICRWLEIAFVGKVQGAYMMLLGGSNYKQQLTKIYRSLLWIIVLSCVNQFVCYH